jgi:hypothetical protein
MRKTEIHELAKTLLSALQPDETARFVLPVGQPGRRILYGVVNGVAYSVLGAGQYRIRTDAPDITVTRLL